MTGYESYTAEEREELIAEFAQHIRDEQRNAEGDGLRAQIARANLRSFEATIESIRTTGKLLDNVAKVIDLHDIRVKDRIDTEGMTAAEVKAINPYRCGCEVCDEIR